MESAASLSRDPFFWQIFELRPERVALHAPLVNGAVAANMRPPFAKISLLADVQKDFIAVTRIDSDEPFQIGFNNGSWSLVTPALVAPVHELGLIREGDIWLPLYNSEGSHGVVDYLGYRKFWECVTSEIHKIQNPSGYV